MLLPKEARFEVLFLRFVLFRVDMRLFLECFICYLVIFVTIISFFFVVTFYEKFVKIFCEYKRLMIWSLASWPQKRLVLCVIVRINLSTVHTNLWPLGSFVSLSFFVSSFFFFSFVDLTVRPRSCGKYGKTDGEIASFIYNV